MANLWIHLMLTPAHFCDTCPTPLRGVVTNSCFSEKCYDHMVKVCFTTFVLLQIISRSTLLQTAIQLMMSASRTCDKDVVCYLHHVGCSWIDNDFSLWRAKSRTLFVPPKRRLKVCNNWTSKTMEWWEIKGFQLPGRNAAFLSFRCANRPHWLTLASSTQGLIALPSHVFPCLTTFC